MRLKDIISPSRWRSFMIYLLRSLLKRLDKSEWTPEVHEVEQFMYRYLTCSSCLKEGRCVQPCKCLIPQRMHVRTDHCPAYPQHGWPPFKSKEGWEKFKEEEGLEFMYIKNKRK